MKKIVLAFIAVAALAVTQTEAAIITYTTILSGPAEAPPNASPGTGAATVVVNDVLHTMSLSVLFSGLIGTTTASHIHCCTAAPGMAGVATTTPTFAGFPLGVTSGTYSVVLDLTAASSYNPAFLNNPANGGMTSSAEATLLAGMAANQTYLNIHTTVFSGGEIRGFLAVPEPTSLSLVGLGIAGAMLLRRRRQRN